MRKIEPEFITGMGYIGASPGVLYRMGGAGEQTVVTGNTALLEGVKGNRFTSLTLHGKSTQVSTTGAQLLDISKWTAYDEATYGLTMSIQDDIVRLKGTLQNGEVGEEINSMFRFIKTSPGTVFPENVKFTAEIINNTGADKVYFWLYGLKEYTPCIVISFVATCGKKIDIQLRPMLYVGDLVPEYEPYTGGAPSPSPSYPQEIENAGQSGEIGVDVYGGNLFDKSTAIFGGVVDKDNGNIARNERYACSDYIAIPRGISFLYQTGGALNQRAFYDAGKIYISAAGSANKTDIPTNARYIRITSAIGKQDMSDIILNIGSTALPYEPYKPAQKLIIPTSGGLPGIPVSSGGNYTDEKGQQWVCDEVDFKKGVYVQRVATETPKAQWSSFGETADVPNRYRITGALINKYRSCSDKCLISHGIYTDWGASPGWTLNAGAFYYHPEEDVTKEEVKEQILGFINSANPLTFLGQLETPIEIPLTTEQLAKYKALRTYSPTTTVINDAGAGMSAGYRRK